MSDALKRSLRRMGSEGPSSALRLRVVDDDGAGPVLQARVRNADLTTWHWDWLKVLTTEEAVAWRAALDTAGDTNRSEAHDPEGIMLPGAAARLARRMDFEATAATDMARRLNAGGRTDVASMAANCIAKRLREAIAAEGVDRTRPVRDTRLVEDFKTAAESIVLAAEYAVEYGIGPAEEFEGDHQLAARLRTYAERVADPAFEFSEELATALRNLVDQAWSDRVYCHCCERDVDSHRIEWSCAVPEAVRILDAIERSRSLPAEDEGC